MTDQHQQSETHRLLGEMIEQIKILQQSKAAAEVVEHSKLSQTELLKIAVHDERERCAVMVRDNFADTQGLVERIVAAIRAPAAAEVVEPIVTSRHGFYFEEQKIKAITKAAERERCAQFVEQWAVRPISLNDIARAIRAKKEQP